MAKTKRKAPEKTCPHCGKSNHPRKKECGHCGRFVLRATRNKKVALKKANSNADHASANGPRRKKKKQSTRMVGSGFVRALQTERKKLAARIAAVDSVLQAYKRQ